MSEPDLCALPGAELVLRGLEDAREQRPTEAALLVTIAFAVLRGADLDVVRLEGLCADPEIELYRLLQATEGADAHGRYNALLREVSSFVHALEARRARERARRSASSTSARGT